MPDKAWTNQPDVVVEGEVIIGSMRVNDQIAEVRKLPDGRYTLTCGDLFSSQTVFCSDAERVLRAIGLGERHRRGQPPMKLPEGCELAEG